MNRDLKLLLITIMTVSLGLALQAADFLTPQQRQRAAAQARPSLPKGEYLNSCTECYYSADGKQMTCDCKTGQTRPGGFKCKKTEIYGQSHWIKPEKIKEECVEQPPIDIYNTSSITIDRSRNDLKNCKGILKYGGC